MTTSTLKPGDLIIDASGREAIVVKAVERPDEYWIRGQNDWRVRKIGKCAWWRAIPFSGGTELVPEPLARFLRPATVDDALRFSENWYQSYTALVALFPELARRIAVPSLSGEARGAGVRTVWFPEVPPPSSVFMPRDLDAEAKAKASGLDPSDEDDIAQDLGAAGDYAGALERFLWCFDYGKLARPSYAGVEAPS